jgi:hypothetical protein
MTHEQQRLDGSSFWIYSSPPVPYRTDYEGYERWRHQYRDKNGQKCEKVVGIHRLAAVAWFGFEVVIVDNRIVHHENGIPWDNREENLDLMGRTSHSILHNRGDSND